MRFIVWTGLSVLCCVVWFFRSAEAAPAKFTGKDLDVSGLSCDDKVNDEMFSSKDGCYDCSCDGNEMRCFYKLCPQIYCHEELVETDRDECCPVCKPGCYDEKWGYVKPGGNVTSDDKCTVCECFEGELQCMVYGCAPCLGVVSKDGTCCGHCEVNKCMLDGKEYEIGEEIPDKDPCETCHCEAEDGEMKVLCYSIMCAECRGRWTDDGSCCGVCEPDMCESDGMYYKLGQKVPTGSDCFECSCEDFGNGPELLCRAYSCVPCMGHLIQDGSCCGQCISACDVMGVLYEIGMAVPSTSPCETCTCEISDSDMPVAMCYPLVCALNCPDGSILVQDDKSCCGHCEEIPTPICDPEQCEPVNCHKRMQFKLPGMCCTQCMCKHKGKKVKPGPIGDKCDGLVCYNGEVIPTRPTCPEKSLQCVDAVKGENCCYECPNGRTCSPLKSQRTVIKYGEYKKVKNEYCTCVGEQWFPIAFCAKRKVPKRLLKKYGNMLADYMKLE